MSDRAKTPGPTNALVLAASSGAEDRQRVLNELVRRVLKDFVGRKATPGLLQKAEAAVVAAIDDAIRAGSYVLPDGLVVDRVELGLDRRLKVLFKKAELIKPDIFAELLATTEPDLDINLYGDLNVIDATKNVSTTDEVSYTIAVAATRGPS